MKVKELVEQLARANQEFEVYIAVYLPGDTGYQDIYTPDLVVEYSHKNNQSVQIKAY
jgi:hypothetical protein